MMRKRVYSIVFTRTSEKQFKALAKKVQREIALILEEIARDPLNGKPLHGPLKRLRSRRVGKFRIVYSQDKHALVVVVISIDHRKKVYLKK